MELNDSRAAWKKFIPVLGSLVCLGVQEAFLTGACLLWLNIAQKKPEPWRSRLLLIYLEVVCDCVLYSNNYFDQRVVLAALWPLFNSQMVFRKNFVYKAFFALKFGFQWFEKSSFIWLTFVVLCYELLDANHSKAPKTQKAQKLTTLIESIPIGLVALHSDSRVKSANSYMLSYLGSEENILDSLKGLCYQTKFCFSKETGVFKDIQKCFQQQTNQTINLGITQGSPPLLLSAKKVIWGEKPVLLVFAQNAECLVSLEENKTQNNFKNVLLRSVSHEMRTPLSTVSSIAEQLIENETPNLSSESQENLSVLKFSSRLLLCLVNDLLDYSRILAQAFHVNPVTFDLSELLQNSLKMIQLQAAKKNLTVLLRIDPLLPKVCWSDPTRIEQVIINLLSNALKFTLKGFIELTATYSATKKLKISVKDSGLGIPSEKLPTIFEVFKSMNTSSLNSNGCGLGLHISNLLVRALGGTKIGVKSKVGKGSVFSFEVPISKEESYAIIELNCTEEVPSEAKQPLELREFQTNNFSKTPEILLVDDNEFTRKAIGSLLSSNGFNYAEVSNGKEAVALVSKTNSTRKTIKLVLMDCEMPVMDGREASNQINQLFVEEKLCFLPAIIGCSGYSGPAEVEKSFKCGMAMHLVKPIPNQDLLGYVKQFL